MISAAAAAKMKESAALAALWWVLTHYHFQRTCQGAYWGTLTRTFDYVQSVTPTVQYMFMLLPNQIKVNICLTLH